MRESPGVVQKLLTPLARVGLLIALVAAGWGVYRHLPEGDAPALGERGRDEPTVLRIVLRRPAGYDASPEEKVSVQLYSINVGAARSEYEADRRPGTRFDEFLLRRMGGRPPLQAEFDEHGEAFIIVPQGRWWVHATLDGPEELTWRLPVNVSGREKSVVLSAENVYTRAKSF